MAVSETRVTRGRLLKRAGVGAAALGAGSMITAGTAAAALHPSTSCIDAGGCGEFQFCQNTCECGCTVTLEGCCVCMANVFCDGLPSCTSSSQCPPGWACGTGGCAAEPPNGFCVPHCGYTGPHAVPCNTSPSKPTFSGR
jgi:hypothetical protein